MADETVRRDYSEGSRYESECRNCHQPIWIVYHGANQNHTIEPRSILDTAIAKLEKRAAFYRARQAAAPGFDGEAKWRAGELESAIRTLQAETGESR